MKKIISTALVVSFVWVLLPNGAYCNVTTRSDGTVKRVCMPW